MKGLLMSGLFALMGLATVIPVAVAQQSQPLMIDFQTQGCGRFRQAAYFRTEFHFVNICYGEANLQMVVTDADGLGRERMAATQEGDRFVGTSDRNIAYSIDAKQFSIQLPGQTLYTEKVLEVSNNQSVATPPKAQILRGTVTYRQRIALPPNAVVEVKLVDVSRADAPAITIAEQTIQTNGKQVPIPFTLSFDPNQINPKYRYAVQARITVDGTLRWINTTQYAVLTQGNPKTNVEVVVNSVPSSSSRNSLK